MSDYSTRPAHEGKETGDSSSSDEGSSSPLRSGQGEVRPSGSLWARLARVLRPSQGERLREDFSDALNSDSAVSAAFTVAERGMLNNILRFREVRVEDIMIPRADIDAIDADTTISEAMAVFEETGRSRMPVYREKLDEPVGMIHIRDLLFYIGKQARNRKRGAGNGATGDAADFDLARVDLLRTVAQAGLVRKILFVPPSMRASDLLQQMQNERTQIAIVIDEYGGVDGLVSHEDIVETVVGDIDDEYDRPETLIARVSDDTYIADARIELEDVVDVLGPGFDVADRSEEVDTLGGLIVATLGHIPEPGDRVEVAGGFVLEILDADSRRIKRVRILRPGGDASGGIALASLSPVLDHSSGAVQQ